MANPTTPNPEYDREQADRYRTACEQIRQRGLRDFLDWLCEEPRPVDDHYEVQLCLRTRAAEPEDDDEDQDDVVPQYWPWEPVSPDHAGERLLAAYFEIDLAAVERHRQRLLDEMAAGAPEGAA